MTIPPLHLLQAARDAAAVFHVAPELHAVVIRLETVVAHSHKYLHEAWPTISKRLSESTVAKICFYLPYSWYQYNSFSQ